MTKRDRVTVNLIPSDADWLRREAEDHSLSLSEVLQTLIGAARVRADMEEQKEAAAFARRLKKDERLLARLSMEGRQLDLSSGVFLPGRCTDGNQRLHRPARLGEKL